MATSTGPITRKRRRMQEDQKTLAESELEAAFTVFVAASQVSKEVAMIQFIQKYRISMEALAELKEKFLPDSFSNVTYAQVAPLFGLRHERQTEDMERFTLKRVRIPMGLYRQIIVDAEGAGFQYGGPVSHENEEARQRFISAFFDRLVGFFEGRIHNKPETNLKGRISKGGRVEYQYFVVDGCLVLLIEVKLDLSSGATFFKYVAQVICELDGVDYLNFINGVNVTPMRGVLTDGQNFFFFEYDGSTRTIRKGDYNVDVGSIHSPQLALNLVTRMKQVCEVFLWMLVDGWCLGIEAMRQKSEIAGTALGVRRSSHEHWEKALQHGKAALETGLAAAAHSSEIEASYFLSKLQESFRAVPMGRHLDLVATLDANLPAVQAV